METWDIWYIDESFLVWIVPSRHQSHESIYWACTTDFVAYVHLITWCLLHIRVCMLTIRFSMHTFDSNLFIHVCLSLHATWHSSHHSLGIFWLPWICMVQILKLELWWCDCICMWPSALDCICIVLYMYSSMRNACISVVYFLYIYTACDVFFYCFDIMLGRPFVVV